MAENVTPLRPITAAKHRMLFFTDFRNCVQDCKSGIYCTDECKIPTTRLGSGLVQD